MNSLPEKLTNIIFFVWRTLNAPSPDVAEVIMTAMISLSLRKYSDRFILLSAEYEIYGRLYSLTAPIPGLLAHARIINALCVCFSSCEDLGGIGVLSRIQLSCYCSYFDTHKIGR